MIVALFLVCVVATAQAAVTQGTFSTRVDHSRAHDSRRTPFTYYENLEHYVPGGPFYIYIKESSDSQWIENGLMVDIAANTSAALFTFDLRYFGDNIPTSTLSVNDLQYMEIDQMLGDIATFIAYLRQEFATETRNDVILYGRGYGGTIAVWARKKLPHLVDGAWSSSGVFEIGLASLSVYDSLSYVFYRTSIPGCRYGVQAAFRQLDALVVSGDSQRIQEVLNLCNLPDTNSLSDVGTLFHQHISTLMTFLENTHLDGVYAFCETMPDPEEADGQLEAFGRWMDLTQGIECRDFSYSSLIESLSSTDANGPTAIQGDRQEFYWQCSQTGLFQITDSITWLPNRIEYEYYNTLCQDIFGEEFDTGLLRQANNGLRQSFGSLYQRVTNVIYSNGELDPWMSNGIQYTSDRDSIVLNINYYLKSADFPSVQPTDRPNLVEIKHYIYDRIVSWSAEPEITPFF